MITAREDFPRVEVTREPRDRGVKLYGPFASAGSLRGAVQVLQRIFKFRTCSLDIEEGDERWRWFRPCLLASINQCTAPCNLRISKEDYRRDIRRLQMFLRRGQADSATADARGNAGGVEGLQFEQAARLRDEIHMLETLDQRGELDTHAQPEVFYIDPHKGLARTAPGAEAGRDTAHDRRDRHRASPGGPDRGQPGAIHRRAAVQAGISPLQDPRGGMGWTTSAASTRSSRAGTGD